MRLLRDSLRDLHRALFQVERLEYERSFGRIDSDFYLLELAADDPQFAWLRALTRLMLDVDVHVASIAPVSAKEMRLLATRIRALLLSGDRMIAFQDRYQRALQEHPEVVMAHSVVIRLLPPASSIRVFVSKPSTDIREEDGVRVAMHNPGELVPGHGDHGYGPLARIVEAHFSPGAEIRLHEHRNDEIVSWVGSGLVLNNLPESEEAEIDSNHLLVMNTGRQMSHAERALLSDPPSRLVQLFIRPQEISLQPRIQFGELSDWTPNTWRKLVAPVGEDAPFGVRNDIEMYDLRIGATGRIKLPKRTGWDAWLFVHEGAVEADNVPLSASEHALI